MDSIPEIIVASDSSNQATNCYIYELTTGNTIHSYKEGKSAKKCLSFIGQDYIISGLQNKAALKAWVLNPNIPETCDMIIPGSPSALDVSNCGMYCAVGVGFSFYVWDVATGVLLSTVEHHSKPITCIKFSADGSHLITAGKDGMVLVWIVSQIVTASEEQSENVRPRYVWLDHAAEITDMHVGNSSIFAQVATVSKDMTCKIHDLECGRLLTTIHVDFVITAVTMDDAEYFLMLGSAEGNVYRINLFSINESDVKYNSADRKYIYAGHTKEITCLSVSTSGQYLLSGSEDGELKLWDVMNFTCVRKFSLNGPVTNAFITLMPPGFKNYPDSYPILNVNPFNRQFEANDVDYITAHIQPKKLTLWNVASPNDYFDHRLLNYSEESLSALNRNNVTEKMMSAINHQIYSFALSETYTLAKRPNSHEDSD